MKVSIDIFGKYFSFIAYQRSVQLLYETLGTLIKALAPFTVSLSFADKQTDKSKDQALKQHYFSRIGPDKLQLVEKIDAVIKQMRWKVNFYAEKDNNKNFFGWKSDKISLLIKKLESCYQK